MGDVGPQRFDGLKILIGGFIMRKFNITVNGKTYEVEVEEITGGAIPETALAAPVQVAQPVPQVKAEPVKPVPAAQPTQPAPKKVSAAPAAGGETISCPMPGTILAVNVKQGDMVKKGDVLFILEAMKMENEIMAPRDGRIVDIGVSKGASANTGDMLAVIS